MWIGPRALNAWPNAAFTIALLANGFYRAAASGYSAVGVFSERAERAFVETVRRRVGVPEVE